MNNIKYEKGSFRDPAGRIFYKDGKVFRNIGSQGIKRFEFIKKTNILEESIKNGFVVETSEIEDQELKKKIKDCELILNHKKINYISYPYEWSFNQLKDAALHHLNFQLYLIERDAVLIDGSAYNIQFINSKPIFIDILSIDEYKDGAYWVGHKQFCENFLNPLILSSKKNIDFNNWFKGNLEGVRTSDLNSILSFTDKMSPSIFFQVYLLNLLENKSIKDPKKTANKFKKIKPFPKKSYVSLLKQMKKIIEKLHPFKKKTVWDDYSEKNTYSKEDEAEKIKIVNNFVKKNNFNLLADIGCNDGLYSFECLKSGCSNVIGFDYDLKTINNAYIKAKEKNLNFLPLYFDASNPSPNLGWNESERSSFQERLVFDGMIALAFEHHLIISKNIPINDAIKWLINIAPKGLIEFVPKNDKTIQSMILLKGDIFPHYNEENFKLAIEENAVIKSVSSVGSSGRKIYEYSKV